MLEANIIYMQILRSEYSLQAKYHVFNELRVQMVYAQIQERSKRSLTGLCKSMLRDLENFSALRVIYTSSPILCRNDSLSLIIIQENC